ncbi:MAG: glycosyltransferase family 4 protein [Acidimicrobiales bacterium]
MQQFIRSWLKSTPRWKAVVIPHAVDAGAFPFVLREARNAEPIRLLSLGHPAPHKGLEVAIRTVQELRTRGVEANLTLTIDGNGYRNGVTGYTRAIQAYVDQLVLEVRRLRVDDLVDFHGPVKDVRGLYASHDALFFPSHTESFGFPLLEAMASGLPVVASDIPATREVVAGHGWLFPDGDHVAAAETVLDAMAQSTSERSAAARKYAETQTWSRNAQQVAALMDEVMTGHPSQHRRPRSIARRATR